MSVPVTVTPEGHGFRVKLLDGSFGLMHSGGVYAPDATTAVACLASLLGVSDVQLDSPVLDAMREVMSKPQRAKNG